MDKLIQNKKEELKLLCQKYDVKSMYIFGSACNESFNENSDLDFLVTFDNLCINQYTNNYFDLHYNLESLFNRKIDLFTDRSLSNPYFIKSINQSKQLIYEA
ncbi:MAG: nucleotidyltransferase family protein [Saprospiraceae bacterium]